MQNKFDVAGVKKSAYILADGEIIQTIKIDNPFCQVEIAELGAQVLNFYCKNKAREMLWCTSPNYFKVNKPIRGGTPFCFPWFGNHPTDKNLPAHGFARNSIWQLTAIEQKSDQSHQLIFTLQNNDLTHKLWHHDFLAEMTINCSETLTLDFKITNTDQHAYSFGFAWHSYFKVDEILNTQIEGFDGTSYFDQLTQQHKIQQDDINFNQEFDCIYQNTSGHYQIKNHGLKTKIDSPSCQSAVVWNPWQDKTIRLGDVEANAWHQFVCVESGQIAENEVEIQPNQQLKYKLHIQVL